MKFLSSLLIMFSFVELKSQEFKITQDFLDKVALIESNGNPNAVGDNGKAIGMFQMHQEAWQDAVFYIKNYEADLYDVCISTKMCLINWKKDCTDIYYSETLAFAYFKLLKQKYELKNKKPLTEIVLYMIYNMGYSGAKKYDFNPEHEALPKNARLAIKRAKLYFNQ